jgi:hypothetical protein
MTALVIPLPPLPTERACPDCHEPQVWCDSPACLLPQGHWSHLDGPTALACALAGGRLVDAERRVTS